MLISQNVGAKAVTPLQDAASLIPSGFRCGNNVGGNIGDGFVIKTSSESRHGVLSVGHLSDDGLLVTSTSKVGFKGLLLKGLFGHDDVLSSGVASSAVGVEDLLSVVNVSGKSWLDSKSESDGTSGGGLNDRSRKKGNVSDPYSHSR